MPYDLFSPHRSLVGQSSVLTPLARERRRHHYPHSVMWKSSRGGIQESILHFKTGEPIDLGDQTQFRKQATKQWIR